MHKVFEILDVNIGAMLIVRLDVFWDKQRVDNCTKSRTEGEVSILVTQFVVSKEKISWVFRKFSEKR